VIGSTASRPRFPVTLDTGKREPRTGSAAITKMAIVLFCGSEVWAFTADRRAYCAFAGVLESFAVSSSMESATY
jgi:hypothetical protein